MKSIIIIYDGLKRAIGGGRYAGHAILNLFFPVMCRESVAPTIGAKRASEQLLQLRTDIVRLSVINERIVRRKVGARVAVAVADRSIAMGAGMAGAFGMMETSVGAGAGHGPVGPLVGGRFEAYRIFTHDERAEAGIPDVVVIAIGRGVFDFDQRDPIHGHVVANVRRRWVGTPPRTPVEGEPSVLKTIE